jgi:protein ImuB
MPITQQNASLLPDALRQNNEDITHCLERIAAGTGADKLLRPLLVEDYRLEWIQQWQRSDAAPRPKKDKRRLIELPQPA